MGIFIGNKKTFGVEVMIESKTESGYYVGFSKLWICKKFIGTLEDKIYLNSYVLDALHRMLNVPHFDDSFLSNTDEKYLFFKRRSEDLNDNEIKYFTCNFGTMSDDFAIWAYRTADELVILWKLETEPALIKFSDLENYGNEAHEGRVLFSEFSSCVLLLTMTLSTHRIE